MLYPGCAFASCRGGGGSGVASPVYIRRMTLENGVEETIRRDGRPTAWTASRMGGTIGCARREATLAGLEFAPTGGLKDTFVGVPRSAVLIAHAGQGQQDRRPAERFVSSGGASPRAPRRGGRPVTSRRQPLTQLRSAGQRADSSLPGR